ncbi:hypothetical protein [Kitasatospora sp. NPDC090091]|uniref:hypothetical protein n=1 Tax=Kitasatospora sp. NPDC090091 TaxID=3364081 RepID=UPI0038262C6D
MERKQAREENVINHGLRCLETLPEGHGQAVDLHCRVAARAKDRDRLATHHRSR